MTTYTEIHRPQFHFSAKENWLNDPNGLVYADGKWHLFFQHNTEAPTWGPMSWGHAISPDLIHWQQIDPALTPDEMGSMFSGSAIVDHHGAAGFGQGTVLAFYTAAGSHANPPKPYTQCLAYSRDSGMTWTKYDANPVLPSVEKESRDPKVIWYEPTRSWIMALYLTGDSYALYTSTDAKQWQQIQRLTLTGDDECPDFFSLTDETGNERWIFSGASGHYQIGAFDGLRFTPETPVLTVEHGQNGYAAQTWSNAPDWRCVQISWMAGGQYPEMPFNQQMSIPVDLSLVGVGSGARLKRWPVAELHPLRGRTVTYNNIKIAKGRPLAADTQAKLFDISITLRPGDAPATYLIIRGQYMAFDWIKREATFNASPKSKMRWEDAIVPIPEGDSVDIRLLIDLTSVELFLAQGLVSASFCYLPTGYVNPFVVQSFEGQSMVQSLTLHELSSAWSEQ